MGGKVVHPVRNMLLIFSCVSCIATSLFLILPGCPKPAPPSQTIIVGSGSARPAVAESTPDSYESPASHSLVLTVVSGCVTRLGRVWCWGYGKSGHFGISPEVACGDPTHCVTPFEMPVGRPIERLYSGYALVCGIDRDADVYCWGWNAAVSSTYTHPLQLPVHQVRELAIGGFHVCARHIDGSVACWGPNQLGEVGIPTHEPVTSPRILTSLGRVKKIAAGLNHTCAVLENGQLECWGGDTRGELGFRTDKTCVYHGRFLCELSPHLVSGLEEVVDVGAGNHHTCAVVRSGKVYCWGDNLWGQVGGTTAEGCWIASLDSQTKDFCAWQPTEVAGISDAVGLAVADDHSCARLRNGEVVCWGKNIWQQLGKLREGGCVSYTETSPQPGSLACSNRPVLVAAQAEGVAVGPDATCIVAGPRWIDCLGDTKSTRYRDQQMRFEAPEPCTLRFADDSSAPTWLPCRARESDGRARAFSTQP